MLGFRSGSLTWMCVNCPRHNSRDWKAHIRFSDPGVAYLRLLIFLSSRKRHVLIDTLCNKCLDDEDLADLNTQ
jgi:hypothetical protein